MTKIYDREKANIIIEKEPIFIKFLYNTILGRIVLKFFKQPFFSKISCFFLNSKLSKLFIKSFVKKNNINLNPYIKNNFSSFNEFFTRKYKELPIKNSNNTDLISVCESSVLFFNIDSNLNLKIKNSNYTIFDLVQDEKLSNEYINGFCLVFRLKPNNYHRYIYFDNGKLTFSKQIKGVLHSVKPIALEKYPVFIQNSREISVLETENFSKVIQIEIGAMLIGKINNHEVQSFNKYDEKGFFEYGGSTICLLFKENTIRIDEDILENSLNNIETIVGIGEIIGKKEV